MRDLRFAPTPLDACEVCGNANIATARACAACGTPLQRAILYDAGAAVASGAVGVESPRALPSGTSLQGGAYRVESVIGQGGFGITYRATDANLGREVAIKEFFPGSCDRAGRDVLAAGGLSAADFEEGRRAFLEEARALAHFRHQGIVHVYTAWEENCSAYMAMELLRGRTLAEIFTSHPAPLPENQVLALAHDITAALQVVHDQGWLHRDIKPENIVLTDPEADGKHRVVLLDFGAAKQVSGTHTQQLSVVVTPGYAPLEQYATRARRGAYTDIYALCATLYHALSGEAPPAASDRAVGIELRPLRELNRAVSEQTALAIEAGLQTEINRRPQSVRELLDLLEGKTAPQKSLDAPNFWTLPSDVGASPATQSTLASSFGAAAPAPTFAPLTDYDQLRSREVQQAMLSRIAQGNSGLMPAAPQSMQRVAPSGGIAHRPASPTTLAGRLRQLSVDMLLHEYAFMLALGFGLVFLVLLGLSLLAPSPPPTPPPYLSPPAEIQSAPVAPPSQPVAPPVMRVAPVRGDSEMLSFMPSYTQPWLLHYTFSINNESSRVYSPDGRWMARLGRDKALEVTSVDGTSKRRLTLPALSTYSHLRQIAWSLDGDSLITVIEGSPSSRVGKTVIPTHVEAWDMKSVAMTKLWHRSYSESMEFGTRLGFLAGGDLELSTSNGSFERVQVRTGQVLGTAVVPLNSARQQVMMRSMSDNGRYLTATFTDNKGTSHAWVWNAATKQEKLLYTLPHSTYVMSFFSPDGKWLWCQWLDRKQHVRLWRCGDFDQPVAQWDIDGNDLGFRSAFSADSRFVAFPVSAGVVRVWNLSRRSAHDYAVPEFQRAGFLPTLKFSPSRNRLLLCRSESGEEFVSKVLDLRDARVRDVSFPQGVYSHPYGHNVLFSSNERSLLVFGRKFDGSADIASIQ